MLEAESIDPGIWPFDIVAAHKPGARNVVIPQKQKTTCESKLKMGDPQTMT